MTTAENLSAVRDGRSGLRRYENPWGLPFAVCASLLSEEQNRSISQECANVDTTRFESMVLHSVKEALSHTKIDISSPRVLFILSTTKGNVELLDGKAPVGEDVFPGSTAYKIANVLGIVSEPIVVSNACISGVAAQALALDLLDSGAYDYAVVAGADFQGAFIVSGFNCLKALSEDPCRPFDLERMGLNLGEAAATMVFASDRIVPATDHWTLRKGAMRNDAFHITNPSPRGEGCFNALESVMRGEDAEKLAMIGAHGTATMYNDQMESVAIERAGLEHVPVSALKGYFGHTMGAAGLLETILTMKAVSDGWIPGSLGFEECGVSGKVNVCGKHMPTEKTSFVKLMSGFGGCNGALLYDWSDVGASSSETVVPSAVSPVCQHTVRILPDSIVIDGKTMPFETQGAEMLTELYRTLSPDYPRFYRMDLLSKLAFVAVELLLKEAGLTDVQKCDVLLFNRSTSIMSDLKHAETIADAESFFPSPATFVYTLPNIMVGEVAIRHGISGSTSLCILHQKNKEAMLGVIAANMAASANTNGMIAGWVDCLNENEFEAEISIYN